MSNKVKSISCLVISVVGWLVFFAAVLYKLYFPDRDEFEVVIDILILWVVVMAVLAIHVANCIFAVILLLQKTKYKRVYIPGLTVSLLFVICASIFYFGLPDESVSSEDSKYGADLRWMEYTKEHHAPAKEIQLDQTVSGLIFSKSSTGQKALCASIYSKRIDGYDLSSGNKVITLTDYQGGTHSLSFSPDGKRALSGGSRGEVILWDLEKSIEIGRKKEHADYVRSIAYSPVGNHALSGGDSGEILLWDSNSMQIIKKFHDHYSSVGNKTLVWGAGGKTFLSASRGPTIRLWDVETEKELSRLQVKDAMIVSIALSPDGKYALSGHCNGPEQPVIYWDLESQQEINRFGVPGNPWHAGEQLHIESVAFSSDGKTALFGLHFGTVIWWDLNEWKAIAMNRLFEKELAYVLFSEDDKYCIAVGCDENVSYEKAKIRYWELNPLNVN